jgi:hypothetical protein
MPAHRWAKDFKICFQSSRLPIQPCQCGSQETNVEDRGAAVTSTGSSSTIASPTFTRSSQAARQSRPIRKQRAVAAHNGWGQYGQPLERDAHAGLNIRNGRYLAGCASDCFQHQTYTGPSLNSNRTIIEEQAPLSPTLFDVDSP